MTDRTRIRTALALVGCAVLAPVSASAQAAVATAERAQPPAQRYRLVEVAGSALPAQVEKEWRCKEYVTAGALTLATDSTWTLETTTREVCGQRTEEDSDVEGGRYSAAGDSLRFYDDDGEQDRDSRRESDIDLEDLHSGTRAPDGRLIVRLEDGETTAVFRP